MHMSVWPAGSAGGAAVAVARASTLREMHTPAILDAIIVEKAVTPFANCYGLGFRIAKFEDGTLFVGHAGGLPGFGCDHRFLPTHPGLAIISLSNRYLAAFICLLNPLTKQYIQDIR